MNKAAAAAVKELAANERQEVSLTERRKHAAGREKKLKKSLQEVSFFALHLTWTKSMKDV